MRDSGTGFTLVEITIAIGLLTGALVVLAQLAAVSIKVNAEAKYRTLAMIAATQKVEQLRAEPALVDVEAAVEHLNSSGEVVCEGPLACAGALYVRRWSVRSVALVPNAVLIQVSAQHAHRHIGEVHLVTIRGRNVR
ncbi:MAG TPA: hypothetical protein VJM31_13810 [Vicinamibacterales bacterium]|nr:hypothetical protein [Vicinamibacterales bacterium]